MSVHFGITGDGYAWVSDEKTGTPVYVHRLVAVSAGLIDGLSDARHVHHTDGVPSNNGADNLEAVDCAVHCDYHCNENGAALTVSGP